MVTPVNTTAAPFAARAPYEGNNGILPPRNGGVPQGGNTGQVLVKTSNEDFAYTFASGGTVTANEGPLLQHAVAIGNGGVDLYTLSSLGSSGQVLTSLGGAADPAWMTPSGGSTSSFTNPMTTAGDIIYGTTGGAPLRLGAGSTGQVLTMASGLPSWAAATPMTTAGDMIYGTSAGAPLRLAIGSSGQVLTVASGLPSWAAATGASLSAVNVWTKNQSSSPVALTDAATVALDASLSNVFELTATSGVGATRKIGNATNQTSGMVLIIWFYQDSSGSRALTWDTTYKSAGGGGIPAASTAANAVDMYTLTYSGTKSIWLVVQNKGVA